MTQEPIEQVKVEDFKRLRSILEEIREDLLHKYHGRLEKIEARLEQVEQVVLSGEVGSPLPEVEPVESAKFLGSLTSAVAQAQSDLLAEPGPVRYAIGPVKAQIKAHLESDNHGQVKLYLPRPGRILQETTLAQLEFTLIPLGAEEEPAEQVLVPSVVGQPLSLAQKQLEARGLACGKILHEDSDGPIDRVLAQTPSAGATLLASEAVALTISRSRYVEVPNVVGGMIKRVGRILAASGLRFRTVKRKSQKVPEGTVLEQNPGAGELLERRAVVKLTVASSPLIRDKQRKAEATASRKPRAVRKAVKKSRR